MADELFVDQVIAGLRRANRNIRIVALKHARHLWTHTHRKRPY